MSEQLIQLPVPILEHPHWRVNIRPNEYQDQLIPNLGKCLEIIEKTKLSLRGWDYLHLSHRSTERSFGKSWVASWSNFMGHSEYWRFYQSGQFLHLFAVREATEPAWREKLKQNMRTHLDYMDEINWDNVPGYISIINFIYTITEIFEFAARLCQSQIYTGLVNIEIEIKGIKGFILTADWNRAWHSYYSADENNLGHIWSIKSDVLVSKSADYALEAIAWFFERFGWLSPSIEVLRKDQENFLNGHI